MKRYLSSFIKSDIEKKMVFLGGPRQVGKTTFSQNFAQQNFSEYKYYNWDDIDDQKTILSQKFPRSSDLLIFDEIHKYSNWKNHIKGLYDTKKERYKFLITGSARLDMYRKGGDSMMGRYHYYRLHPFSIAEILEHIPHISNIEKMLYSKEISLPLPSGKTKKNEQEIIEQLLEFGGFPEMFLQKSKKDLRRWQKERISRLIKEDIRDTSVISDISKLQILMGLLPERVASKFSLESVRQNIGTAHATAKRWIEILENFYYLYRIYPFTGSLTKSIKKEPKLFLWDWSEIASNGARFENMVGSHLLKYVHFLEDVFGVDAHLQYWADQEGREVDFVVIIDKQPIWAIEVKLSDTCVSKHLRYLQKKVSFKQCFQIVMQPGIDFEKDGVWVLSAEKFLNELI